MARGRTAGYNGGVLERFVSHIDQTGECWQWTGTPSQEYGQFRPVSGMTVRAHRFAYEMGCRVIPKGMHVLHRCDNTRCVRPDHLFVGTDADNTDDRVAKNRQAKGARAGNAKLTEQQVRQIRAEGLTLTAQELAIRFNVSKPCIQAIRSGKTWRHV